MARILIVEDEPSDRARLRECLEGLDHDLVEAESGEQALTLARERLPDLVLLDLNLPGLNGFETARQLKAEAGDQFLPILLQTSLRDTMSKVLGLRIGADDFLTKPVEKMELVARVTNLLALRAKETSLLLKNIELAELHRFKNEMTAMIVHDLKNPMSVIVANLDYMAGRMGDAAALEEPLADSQNASHRILRLIANLTDVARSEVQRLDLSRTTVDLSDLLEGLVRQRKLIAQTRGISIALAGEVGVKVSVDVDLLTRAIDNVLDNAMRHTPRNGRVELSISTEPQSVQLKVGNTGPAVPVELRERIFEKYGQSSSTSGRMNLGLGLYFCRLVAEAHLGRIRVEQTVDFPTVFVLELPTDGR